MKFNAKNDRKLFRNISKKFLYETETLIMQRMNPYRAFLKQI